MNDFLNGFNNGRDRSDGVGGNNPNDYLINNNNLIMRKVYIKVPILIDTDVLHVKEDIVKMFGDDLLVSIDYEEEPDINERLLTLAEQQQIIQKIQSIHSSPSLSH